MPAFVLPAATAPAPARVEPPARRAAAARLLSAVVLALLLAACGGKGKDGTGRSADGSPDGTQLPTPAGAGGGVTGMPAKPGPGHVGPPTAEMAEDVQLDENGNPIPPTADSDALPIDPASVPTDPSMPEPAEPTPDEAVALVRDYYAAINAGDFARAHAMWADGGRASGQSATQFAQGFADTTGISVEVMPPGMVEGAAGSRFLEVPVAYTVTSRDGTQRRFVGAYTLRRSMVEGSTPDQRAWRIGLADIRQLDR